jgi:5-methylcytosine-specific restriction protein A
MASQGNPRWARDELILALDLYMSEQRAMLNPSHPKVVALSKLLNRLPIHDPSVRTASFRNPDGVHMKLGNFLHIDPEVKQRGLSGAGKLDRRVFEEFKDRVEYLHEIANRIRENAEKETEQPSTKDGGDLEEEFPEGRLLTRIHLQKERERSEKAVRQKKEKVLEDTGRLVCEACGFDFAERYGDRGDGFAECHHTVPLAKLDGSRGTRLKDLAIVCANCHRMIHRTPMCTVSELCELILQNS